LVVMLVVWDCRGRVVSHVYWREGLGVCCWERRGGFSIAVVDIWWVERMLFLILRRLRWLLCWMGRSSAWSSASGLCLHVCVLVQRLSLSLSLGLGLGLSLRVGWRWRCEVAFPGAVEGWREGGECCFSKSYCLGSVRFHSTSSRYSANGLCNEFDIRSRSNSNSNSAQHSSQWLHSHRDMVS